VSSCSGHSVAERVRIARMGHRGDGVVETEAGLLYVPGSLPGEIVEVERIPRVPDRCRPVGLDVASPDRVAPICPYFGSCGGCAVQHWTPGRYRSWKRSRVIDALRHAGLEVNVDDLIDAHGNGRRRPVLHARSGTRGTVEVGFAASRSHQVVASAARATPGLKPVAAERRDFFRWPLTRSELARFDAVVLDPPRQGALAQSVELAGSKVPVVIAVSCHPATLARDARALCDSGYRLERVTPVDQFRYSPHVELVARFSRA
jgi:tRNA/tmRNA/rRNA uracil-C5-methylase (TrmA/RlmC/RlmD family)